MCTVAVSQTFETGGAHEEILFHACLIVRSKKEIKKMFCSVYLVFGGVVWWFGIFLCVCAAFNMVSENLFPA